MGLPVQAHASIAPAEPASYDAVVEEIGAVVERARRHVAITANAALVSAYWQIGEIILAHAEGLRRLRRADAVALASPPSGAVWPSA